MNTEKTYTVEVSYKYPPAYGTNAGEFEFRASSAKEAISYAKKEMANSGHDRHDGPLVYKIKR